jgi:hypothetical protein
MSQDDLMIIWEYKSLSVVGRIVRRKIKWMLIHEEIAEEIAYEPGQKIPYTAYPDMALIPVQKIEDLLNDYGAEGWELAGVATLPSQSYFSWYPQVRLQLIFKRPKQEE